MNAQAYQFDAAEARSFSHPVFPGVTKHTLLIQANKLPIGLPTGANARDPVGLNRRIYKDVKESLRTNEALPGSFDLMNLGITVIATSIHMVDKRVFNVLISPEDGIVNGAHTAAIIAECQRDGSIPDEQFVEVRIVTGLDGQESLKADIAKGQNTGIAVKEHTIFNTQGIFDPLRARVADQPWSDLIAWKESDVAPYDVRDLVGVMEALNAISYENGKDSHPIQAYEKWSVPLTRYATDFMNNKDNPDRRLYAALEPLLVDALDLYDRIRHDFSGIFNKKVSPSAGRLRIVEEAQKSKGRFDFPFSGQESQKLRLTKGATFPILAAFRNCVAYDPTTHTANWIGGYSAVRAMWEDAALDLIKETFDATKTIGRTPDVLGKARPHWANLHRLLEVRVLRSRLGESA